MIGIEIEGIPQVKQMLLSVASPVVQQEVTTSAADYLRGQMRKYPEYTYVSRARAYGKTFQSDRQRRWFFAALRSGELVIPYPRTMTLQRNWQIMRSGAADAMLVNDTPYAHFVQQSPQARMMTYRNWRSIQTVVMQEKGRLQAIAQEAFNRALKKLGR